MSTESALFTALAGLVGGTRCTPTVFPQGTAYPAIRYTIRSVPDTTVCGSGGDDTADISVQLDLAAEDFDELRALRLAVIAAMGAFDPPATLQLDLAGFDEGSRCHTATLDYELHPSSA